MGSACEGDRGGKQRHPPGSKLAQSHFGMQATAALQQSGGYQQCLKSFRSG
jgi:hypothetical protein